MPELPDVEAYLACLRSRILGAELQRAVIRSPFLLRTVEPPIDHLNRRRVAHVMRLGKRIVLDFDGDLALVIHLMVAGRLRWTASSRTRLGRITLAALMFDCGTLLLTEAAVQKRASLHVHHSPDVLRLHDPGGIELVGDERPTASLAEFAAVLRRANHTLKRSLTNPRLISGVGNAYSDEILHAARLSPIKLTSRMRDAEVARLYAAAREVLANWTARLCQRFAKRFPGPGDITAFRPEFSVHGKFGHPCPLCATTVQRIRYSEHETNYCPRCQTHGRVLADRSLSRLLNDDWPKSVEDWEAWND